MTDRADKNHIGNLDGVLRGVVSNGPKEYSWLSGRWVDHSQWQTTARAKAHELLHYFPTPAPLDPAVLSVIDRGDHTQQEVAFNTAHGIRVHGTVLVPKGKGPFPAVVALHDHGGFYYFGREKIVAQDWEPEELRQFKNRAYGGRSWASELVKLEFLVLAIDAFYFGSRKLNLSEVSEEALAQCRVGLDPSSPAGEADIETYNAICNDMERLVVKHIYTAGTTWAGMLFHDDRRSIDYLLTRPDVDRARIGCCGLSVGGLRSAWLAGMDSRISCAVVAGWMPTFNSLLDNRLLHHTYMLYVPGLNLFMDLPDIASMTAPGALLVQQCSRDPLYTLEGMQRAGEHIGQVYNSLGIPERYQASFYDTHHEFNIQMQQDAFAWLCRWLKPSIDK